MAEHPGIIFRSGLTGRRAALTGGPDVWEVIRAIKSAHAAEPGLNNDDLVSLVSDSTGTAPRLVTTAALAGLPDDQVLAYATTEGRALVTANIKAFVPLDSRYRAAGQALAGLILVSTKTFPQNRGFLSAITTSLATLLSDTAQDPVRPDAIPRAGLGRTQTTACPGARHVAALSARRAGGAAGGAPHGHLMAPTPEKLPGLDR